VPIKQRECLEYVGQVEEAMVSGLTFEVPKEYADRPLLKVGWRLAVSGEGSSLASVHVGIKREQWHDCHT
jgi:hypothetical protein